MKRILAFVCAVLSLSSLLYAQDVQVDKEGKLWLERNTEPAEANVTGVWSNEEWGDVTLDQLQGGRTITGDGDLWKIDGVVSGKKASLLFSRMGKVEFSAVLDLQQEDTLDGMYANRLITADKPGQKKMVLKRTPKSVVRPALGAENETARIVIYMKRSQGGPGVFLDGRQLVWMDKGYISFRVDPGPHEMYIRGAGFGSGGPYNDPVKLDARAGETHFYEAGRWGTWIKYWQLRTRPEDDRVKDMKEQKPLNAKFVLMDSIVSLDPVPGT
jgi:hypothetical protein